MEIKGQRTKNDRKRRKLEWMFYREKQIMRAVKEAREDTGGGHTGGNGAHALVSDPTAIQGIKAASELKMVVLDDGIAVEKPERWLRVIHNTYKLSDGITKMILIKRFRESKPMSAIADISIHALARRATLVPGSFLLSATENVTTGVPLVVTRLSGSLPMFPITVIVFMFIALLFS